MPAAANRNAAAGISIGSAVGAVSTGIVHHAVSRRSLLTSDIRLAPANSGGPLANAEGAVVGI